MSNQRASVARRIAHAILVRVVRDSAFADRALDAALKRTPMSSQDRALVAELVYGTLRHFIYANFLLELSCLCSSWLCLSIKGRVDPFGKLVNQKAKNFKGQRLIAAKILKSITLENFEVEKYEDIKINEGLTSNTVQDPYSLRCSPQVLGPIKETINLGFKWVEEEINGVSDNPLFDQNDEFANGGNFYGGYLTHAMDYLKISLANMALDRP